ncbi:Chaperone DnaJ-domain superfamily protein [Raphanus sativus]|nr:Chaperone DnaJ-domain superfamily protein [Raphanus sativus]
MEDHHDKSPSPKKDCYKILEVDYDATEDLIRLNYRKLALKWHPDKHKGDTAAKEKFIEINEAYNVLMDPAARFEYDLTGIYEIHKYTLRHHGHINCLTPPTNQQISKDTLINRKQKLEESCKNCGQDSQNTFPSRRPLTRCVCHVQN